MASHNVQAQIEKIAELKNQTAEAVAQELGIRELWGAYHADNRREEGRVNATLQEAKEAVGRAKRLAGFHWVKDTEGWAVAGPFDGHKIGDTISVTKKGGEVQEKVIVRFSENGNAYVK